jgi:hypothetical protein
MALGYALTRMPLYALLWVVAVIELGLTGFRVEHTRHVGKFYDPIIVELLVTSALTILWVPYASWSLNRLRTTNANGMTAANPEHHGNFVLWVMWLVGSAIATNDWPTAAVRGVGKQSRILAAILAFGWTGFALLTLIGVVGLMHYAAASAVGGTARGGVFGEKRTAAV